MLENDSALGSLSLTAFSGIRPSRSNVKELPAQNSGQSSRFVLSTVTSLFRTLVWCSIFVLYHSPCCLTSIIRPVRFSRYSAVICFLQRASSYDTAAISVYSRISLLLGPASYIFVKNRSCCLSLKFLVEIRSLSSRVLREEYVPPHCVSMWRGRIILSLLQSGQFSGRILAVVAASFEITLYET